MFVLIRGGEKTQVTLLQDHGGDGGDGGDGAGERFPRIPVISNDLLIFWHHTLYSNIIIIPLGFFRHHYPEL